jgi:hypothetical protein
MNLYQIAEEYNSLFNDLYDPESGEIQETALIKLDEIKVSLEEKAINIALFMQNLDAEQKAIENAMASMKDRANKLEKKREWLHGYLKFNMEQAGHLEISCPYFSIKVKSNPYSTEILDEALIPDKYKVTKEVVSVNKTMIKQDIQNGLDVPGARIKKDTKLTIK